MGLWQAYANDAYLQPGLDKLLSLRQLLQKAVADDETIPELLLFKQAHGSTHQASAHQLLAQLSPQSWPQRECNCERIPAVDFSIVGLNE